jgi:hypothetical protein
VKGSEGHRNEAVSSIIEAERALDQPIIKLSTIANQKGRFQAHFGLKGYSLYRSQWLKISEMSAEIYLSIIISKFRWSICP